MFAFPPARARLGVEARAPGRCIACVAPSPDGEARMGIARAREHLHAAVLGSLIEGGFEDAARQVLEQKTRVAVAILLPRGVGLLRGERGGGRAQDEEGRFGIRVLIRTRVVSVPRPRSSVVSGSDGPGAHVFVELPEPKLDADFGPAREQVEALLNLKDDAIEGCVQTARRLARLSRGGRVRARDETRRRRRGRGRPEDVLVDAREGHRAMRVASPRLVPRALEMKPANGTVDRRRESIRDRSSSASLPRFPKHARRAAREAGIRPRARGGGSTRGRACRTSGTVRPPGRGAVHPPRPRRKPARDPPAPRLTLSLVSLPSTQARWWTGARRGA